MRTRTRQNTITQTIGKIPYEILGPNLRRKSFLLSPLPPSVSGGGVQLPIVFNAGAGQLWTVPPFVHLIDAAYAWGAGGNPGAAGALLGGGSGGGGGFARIASTVVIPGDVYTVNVGAGGSQSPTSIITPTPTTILNATAGTNGVLDAKGVKGTGTIGLIKEDGGDGGDATALSGSGAGGGGAGGSDAPGSAPTLFLGGAGGGTDTIGSYGAGGAGGNGQTGAGIGNPGVAPGGGGGGSFATDVGIAPGADGLAVIFYTTPTTLATISLSHRSDVTPGAGVINYIAGATYPTFVTDNEIGDAICLPWYIVCSEDSTVIQIVEYSYDEVCNGDRY